MVSDFLTGLIESALLGIAEMFKLTATVWFYIPSPRSASGVVDRMDNSLAWIAGCIAMLSAMAGIGKMMFTQRAEHGRNVIVMFFLVIASGSILATTVFALIAFGDAFAPWIASQIAGQDVQGDQMADFLTAQILGYEMGGSWAAAQELNAFSLVALILLVLLFVASLAQVAFMLLRAPILLVIVGLLPIFAADTTSEQGMYRFRKAIAFCLAFVAYKPVAAIIYGASLAMIKGSEDNQIMSLVWGFVTMFLAALALPALIHVMMPAAAVGSSSATSGASALGATGAAVMGAAAVAGMFATGGSSAAAGAAAGGGSAGNTVPALPGGGSAPALTSAASQPQQGGGGGSSAEGLLNSGNDSNDGNTAPVPSAGTQRKGE